MTATSITSWHEANQRYLMMALEVVRAALERHAAHTQDAPEPEGRNEIFGRHRFRGNEPTRALQEAADAMPAPPALETLGETFGLTPFECDLLLLCAGMELDSTFAALCAAAQGDSRRAYPTFGLALAALPEAQWSAMTPAAPLRYWRLVEVGTGDTLTTRPLRVDERMLHYLAGVTYLDERLRGLVEPLGVPGELPPSHRALVHKISGLWSRMEGAPSEPVIQLCGEEDAGKHAVAAAASGTLGLQLYAIRADDIPAAIDEREALARLWEREAVLSGSALLLDCQDLDGADSLRPALSLLERVRGVLIVTSREPLRARKRPLIRLDVNKPGTAEQRSLWQDALGPLAPELNGQIEALTTQFDLGTQGIRAASAEVLEGLSQGREEALDSMLWEACRAQSRPRLDVRTVPTRGRARVTACARGGLPQGGSTAHSEGSGEPRRRPLYRRSRRSANRGRGASLAIRPRSSSADNRRWALDGSARSRPHGGPPSLVRATSRSIRSSRQATASQRSPSPWSPSTKSRAGASCSSTTARTTFAG